MKDYEDLKKKLITNPQRKRIDCLNNCFRYLIRTSRGIENGCNARNYINFLR